MHNFKCEAECNRHIGLTRRVFIPKWGRYWYCEEAIEEDKRRGFNPLLVTRGKKFKSSNKQSAPCSHHAVIQPDGGIRCDCGKIVLDHKRG